MNICFIPNQKGHFNNQLFDKSSDRDGILSIFSVAKERLSEVGHTVNTIDVTNGKIDVVVFFRIEFAATYLVKCLRDNPNVKIVQYITEPRLIVPFHNEDYFNSDLIDVVLTWDNRFPNNSKIVENRTYWYGSDEPKNTKIEFSQKKFLCLIASNKSSYSEGELYSERLKSVQYFGEKEEIDLFGVGWGKSQDLIVKRSYLGMVKSKIETLAKYKFAITFENSKAEAGYITEKIFDCFNSCCVPVYYGEPNIQNYIPDNTYIDFRKFKSYQDLESYLKSMTEEEYQNYIENIEKFRIDQASSQFKEHAFSDNLLKSFDELSQPEVKRSVFSYKLLLFKLLISNDILLKRKGFFAEFLKAILLR